MDCTKEDIKREVLDELYWDYRVDASEIKAAAFTAGVVEVRIILL